MNTLSFEIVDGVAEITLARPDQRNALDLRLLEELSTTLDGLAGQPEVRTLLVTGEGRGFCAGADVDEWAAAEASGKLETYGWIEAAHGLFSTLHDLDVPTVAAINGAAVGAGLDLALCCDLRLASARARFRAGYTTMAYCPDGGSSWHLPRIVGIEAAKRFLYLDQIWDADRALRQGLVGEVHPPDELLSAARAVAARLAAGPTVAIRETKHLINQAMGHDLRPHLVLEREAGTRCGRTEDATEALGAAAEGRDPKFIGR